MMSNDQQVQGCVAGVLVGTKGGQKQTCKQVDISENRKFIRHQNKMGNTAGEMYQEYQPILPSVPKSCFVSLNI